MMEIASCGKYKISSAVKLKEAGLGLLALQLDSGILQRPAQDLAPASLA